MSLAFARPNTLSVGGSEKPKPLAQTPPPTQKRLALRRAFLGIRSIVPELGWYWARDGEPPGRVGDARLGIARGR